MMVVVMCIIQRGIMVLITWRFLSDHHSLLSRREKGNLSILPMFARVSPVIRGNSENIAESIDSDIEVG